MPTAASRNDYDDLEMHFRQGHFLCEHEACLAKKFVVFAAESEMKVLCANMKRYVIRTMQRNMEGPSLGLSRMLHVIFQQASGANELTDKLKRVALMEFPGISLLSEDFLVTHNQVLSSTCNQIPEQKTASSLLDESSFPPLPVAPSSSGQRSRNTRSINTVDSSIKKIATHKSHRNTVEVLNSSRALAPPPSCQPDSSMSCLSRPVLDSKLSSPSNSPSFSQNKLATNDNLSSSNVSSTQSRSSTANDLVLSLNIANSLRNRSSFCNVNRSSTAPNLVERENFDKTMSNSQVNKKGTTSRHPVLKVENVQTANKALVEKICATLDFDKDKFDAFKVISVEYRQDIIDTAEYLAYVGQFGLAHLVPELAVLCPTQKQRELVEMYYLTTMRNSSNENGSSIDDGGQKSKESSKKGKEKREDD